MSESVSRTATVGPQGEIRLDNLPFPPGEEVRVLVEPVAASILTRVARLGEELGVTGPTDGADRHDDHLYEPSSNADSSGLH